MSKEMSTVTNKEPLMHMSRFAQNVTELRAKRN